LVFVGKTPAWTVGLLVALWVFLMIPAMHVPSIRNASGWSRGLSVLFATMIVSIGVVSFGFNVWPVQGIGRLSTNEQEKFIDDIKPVAAKAWPVQLMCPPTEERECVAASQFVQLFGRAGWPQVHQYVDRVQAGNPGSGVFFVRHSTADVDYNNPVFRDPKVGVWTEVPPNYASLEKAFAGLGIKTSSTNGVAFPSHQIGIYFGTGSARP
jgi:hypothetical protein